MQRSPRLLSPRLLCLSGGLIALLTGGLAPSFAQQTTQADAQATLQTALKKLDSIAPQLDPETRKSVPATRMIIERVCLHPDTATPSEKKIAGIFMYSTRDVFDDTKVEFTKSIKETAKAAMKFIGTQELIPGKKIGVVLLQTEATPDPTKLVEIPDGTSKLPVDQRAMIVAKRLEKADLRDPLFWSHLTVSRRNKQVVVALNNTRDGYIITADKDFATERGISPEALADELITTIRTSVDPGPDAHTRDLVADDALTPTERLTRANQLKQLADDAYGQKDMAKAERNYQHAIRLAPAFAVPYIRLATLYLEQGDKSKAQDILTQAQQVKSLNDQQKREISVLAKRAK